MCKKSAQLTLAMLVILFFMVVGGVQAGEIIYADDIREKIITKEVLVRTADNVIVLVDTSSSLAAKNKTYQKSYYELQKAALTTGFGRLPDLGYNVGLYRFTPWEVLYPMQKFDAAGVTDALKKLPAEPAGRTPLVKSLNELETVLKGLTGKTFVYIFSDGDYDSLGGMSPGNKTTAMAKNYDVCFQVIDYAKQERGKKTVSDMARANMCSRVIPFDSYITQPYYGIGPLFYTKWDTEVVTVSEKKVAGFKVDNILFDLNKSELTAAGQETLTKVGKFMMDNPSAYSVLFGYTDDTGKPEYNMELSRRRSEAGADYLHKNFNLGTDRVIPMWYGADNPVASNDTKEGRAKNRRIEVSIGGL